MSEYLNNIRYKLVTSLDGTESLYLDDANSDVPKKITYSNFVSTVSGNITLSYVSKTANYTLTSTDTWVKCDGTFTITLPTAIGITGKQYIISNVGTGVITVDANGSQTIQGDLTQDIYQYESLTIASDGANWIVI